MRSEELAPRWLFLLPVIVPALLASTALLIFSGLELHPARLLGLLALMAAAINLGTFFKSRRQTLRLGTGKAGALPFLAWFLIVGILSTLGILNFLTTPRALPQGITQSVAVAIFFLAAAFGLHVTRKIVMLGAPRTESKPAALLGLWLLNTQWVSIWASVALLLLHFKLFQAAFWMTQILSYWILALALELLIKILITLFRSSERYEELTPDLLLLEAVFQGKNPFSRLAADIREEYGIDLGTSKIGPFFREGLPALLALLALSLWALSALVIVNPHELGIRERLGKSIRPALQPGLHMKLPWPLERVLTFPAKRFLSMTIGYEAFGQAQDMIWSKPHGRKEYRFPVGNASEIISVDAVLFYEISDVFAYAYHTQNPDTALAAFAYNTLYARIASTSFNELVSVDRSTLSDELTGVLNTRATAERLGLSVVHMSFLSIHPPFEVADAYQRVVSSHLAKEARILRAYAYRERVLPAAWAQAESLISTARADSALRVGTARGESKAFIARAEARKVVKKLLDQDLRLGMLQDIMEGKEYVVLDRRVSTKALQPWIDLRQTKNKAVPEETIPDLADPWDGEGALR